MGYFQDHFASKDGDSSAASDMNDSAYMSQPDSTRKSGVSDGSIGLPIQDFKAHGYPVYSNSLCSPSTNPESFNPFQATAPDMSQMTLPTSESESSRNAIGEYTTDDFSGVPAFTFTNDAQAGWPATDAQAYSGSFAFHSFATPSIIYQHSTSPTTYHQPMLPHDSYAAPASGVMSQQTFPPQTYYSFQSSPDDTQDMAQNTQTVVPDTSYEDADEDEISSNGQEDSETTKLARTHPLYSASPNADDDLYHCPHEGEAGCGHKPTKLKCNYDKYVDSHLRPFRCKAVSCVNTPFSSTACLLRHEREAHGMHGHGSKPHLCSFPDCERSLPGNGFPRRYNLFDHMKRVHDYTGNASPLDQESASTSASSVAKRSTNRKRKATDTPEEVSEKRQKSSKTPTIDPAVLKAQEAAKKQREALVKQFTAQRKIVFQLLEKVQDPNDDTGYADFMKASDLLKDIMRAKLPTSG